MKRAFLDDARPPEVAHALREVVERRGGLVSEHVSSHVRFTHRPEGRAWLRGGYVGIYQPLGESQLEVRLILRARWPRRIFWGVAFLNVVLLVTLLATQPDGNTWILAAIVGGFALLAAGLLLLNTLQPVRDEEVVWMRAFEEELRAELPTVGVEDAIERERREIELAIEGELAARRVARARKNEPKAEKGRRFSLRLNRKQPEPVPAADESPADRLARLRARKAELEAQQQEKRE